MQTAIIMAYVTVDFKVLDSEALLACSMMDEDGNVITSDTGLDGDSADSLELTEWVSTADVEANGAAVDFNTVTVSVPETTTVAVTL